MSAPTKVVLAYSGGLDTSVILLAPDDLRLRGSRLHRRPRPGRGARAGAAARPSCSASARRTSSWRICARSSARLCLPDVPRQRALRGPVPARLLDRPAADRQAPARSPRRRCRRGRARRHRQGQRPGALRARRLRAGPGDVGDRALARVGFTSLHPAHRVRRGAPDPDRPVQRGDAPFWVDANLLHISSEGDVLEDPAEEAPPYVYQRTVDPRPRPTGRGMSRSASSPATRSRRTATALSPAALLTALNVLGGRHGVGRLDLARTASSA